MSKPKQTGFLEGTWVVACPADYTRHHDIVTGITRNHDCEIRGCGVQSVKGGEAMVVCRSGHLNPVSGITRSRICAVCGQECRR